MTGRRAHAGGGDEGREPAAPRPMEERPPRPLVVGVLGGIASGKSAAAAALAGQDGLVVSADALAHEVLASPEVAALVRARFGPGVVGADGGVDRGALARLVFDPREGPEARRALEGWTHPRVRARILERLSAARAAGVPRVVLDVPLLLENDAEHGLARLCHALVFVDSDLEERDRRARHTRGWATGEVARREAVQLSLEHKRARADFVLVNDGSLADLERESRRIARAIEERASGTGGR